MYSGNDFIDGDYKQKHNDLVEKHILRFFKNLDYSKIYKGSDLISKHLKEDYLAFSCGCQIKMNIAKDIKFLEGIMAEDAHYAPVLISKCLTVGILDKSFYKRRIRPFSITDFGNQHTKKTLPKSLEDIYRAIPDDYEAKIYYQAYSCCCICNDLHKRFIACNEIKNQDFQNTIQRLIISRIPTAFASITFVKDPRNCRKMLEALQEYKKYASLGGRIAYYYPKIYKILKKIKNILKNHNL